MSELSVEEILREIPDALLLLSSGNLLFGTRTAAKLVPLLLIHKARVLGLDGFTTDGQGISPTEYVADFSELNGLEASHQALERIIDLWLAEGGPQFVEITIE
jgi:hypothetical protein